MRIWALNARLGNSAYKFCSPDGKSLDLRFLLFPDTRSNGNAIHCPCFFTASKN